MTTDVRSPVSLAEGSNGKRVNRGRNLASSQDAGELAAVEEVSQSTLSNRAAIRVRRAQHQ
jgi:hypothetical protein